MTTDPFDALFRFSEADRFHIAIEEDIWTVHRTTGRLTTTASRILKATADYEQAGLTLKPATPAQLLTTCTPLVKSANAVEHAARSNHVMLAGVARRHGCGLSREPVPVKPFLPQASLALARDARPKGDALMNAYTAGLRIRIGIGDRREAIKALNVVRLHLPSLLVHSACSPQRDAVHGLASHRYVRWRRATDAAVVPPFCANWQAFVQTAAREGFRDDPLRCAWAVRLLPDGTIETRVCDVQRMPEKTASLAAATRMLVRGAALGQLQQTTLAPGTLEHRLQSAAEGKWPAGELAEALGPLLKDRRHRDDAEAVRRLFPKSM